MNSEEFDAFMQGREVAVVRVEPGDELTFCFVDDLDVEGQAEYIVKILKSWFPRNEVRVVGGVRGIVHSPKVDK